MLASERMKAKYGQAAIQDKSPARERMKGSVRQMARMLNTKYDRHAEEDKRWPEFHEEHPELPGIHTTTTRPGTTSRNFTRMHQQLRV